MEDALKIDLSDLNNRMHIAGFGGAVGAYMAATLVVTGSFNLAKLGLFLGAFFPIMYAFEMAIKHLEGEE